MEELVIGDKKYIPSKVAAKITGYAKDYVGQLCREGRIEAKLVGRSWYILESSIREHRFGANFEPSEGTKNTADEVKNENEEANLSTWELPRYTAEEIEVLPELIPTSLISTKDLTNEVSEEVSELSKEEPVAKDDEAVIIEEEIKPVSLHRINHSPLNVSMDIKPAFEAEIRPKMPVIERKTNFKPQKSSSKTVSSKNYLSKAIFYGFLIILASITVIGSGIFDRFGGDSMLLDFFGGVEEVQKP